jgi:hypothetical protein
VLFTLMIVFHSTEGNLDIEVALSINNNERQLPLIRQQYTVGLVTGVPVEFLVVGGYDFTQGLLDTITYLASAPSAPSVVTTSYGDDEDNFSLSDAQFVLAPRARLKVYHSSDRQLFTGACAPDTWHSVLVASR